MGVAIEEATMSALGITNENSNSVTKKLGKANIKAQDSTLLTIGNRAFKLKVSDPLIKEAINDMRVENFNMRWIEANVDHSYDWIESGRY